MTETEIAALPPREKERLATEFLKANRLTWDGRSREEMPEKSQQFFEWRAIATPMGGKPGFRRHARHR